MAQSGQHRYLLLALVSDETPDSPRLTLEKTSCSKSAAEIAENKNRGFCRGTVVKTFGRLYNEFLPTKKVSCKKMGLEGTQGGHKAGGAPSTLVDVPCALRTTFNFPKFLNIPKQRKIAIRTVLEWVYLPYHIPIPFRSLKCSGNCPLCIPPGLWFQ